MEKTKKRDENEKKTYLSRISKVKGQLNGIVSMIENDRYCEDILIQLLATEKAIRSLSNLLLENHMKTCIKKDLEKGEVDSLDKALKLIRRFNK